MFVLSYTCPIWHDSPIVKPEDPTPEAESCDSAATQDLLWMEKVKTGDTEAFRLLIETHQTRVVGTVAKMLGDDTDAEDIAQQVFIRVWNSAARYTPTAKFTTWLFKITRNLVFNELRRRKRHPTASLDGKEEAHAFQAPDLTLRKADLVLHGRGLRRRLHGVQLRTKMCCLLPVAVGLPFQADA